VGDAAYEQESLAGLVRRARDGSETAVEALIGRFQGRIAGFVYSLVGSRDAVPDICQNVFLKMFTGLSHLKTDTSFEPWLYRIARNASFDFLRRQRVRRFLMVGFDEEHEELALTVEPGDRGRIEAFRAALEELPRTQKELILLLADRDWSYEELAKITGTTLASVRSRLFRAREFLRQKMVDDED